MLFINPTRYIGVSCFYPGYLCLILLSKTYYLLKDYYIDRLLSQNKRKKQTNERVSIIQRTGTLFIYDLWMNHRYHMTITSEVYRPYKTVFLSFYKKLENQR